MNEGTGIMNEPRQQNTPQGANQPAEAGSRQGFKPFFIHAFHDANKKMANRYPRGFTVFVSPNTHDETGRTCLVQTTLCAPKDTFNKKAGRLSARSKESSVINKRELPAFLTALNEQCYWPGRSYDGYAWVLKYLL